MSVVVRAALEPEAPAIAALHVAGWRRAYAGIVDAEVLAGLDVQARAAAWRGMISSARAHAGTGGDAGFGVGAAVQVAVRAEDDVLGFCSFGPSRDDDADGRTGEIYAIYIDLDQQGTGVGRALMIDALRVLARTGFERATLWALEHNSLGRDFYDRGGWRLDGARRDELIGPDRLTEVRYVRGVGTFRTSDT